MAEAMEEGVGRVSDLLIWFLSVPLGGSSRQVSREEPARLTSPFLRAVRLPLAVPFKRSLTYT